MLREEKRAGTPLGIEADKMTSQGQLLPDATIVDLVRHWLDRNDSQFIFDGFPRTIGQAKALDEMLAQRGTSLDVAILLEADLATLQGRIQHRLICRGCGHIASESVHVSDAQGPCPRCGGEMGRRSDDTLETFERRMAEYREKTEPLIGHYENGGLLRRVNTMDKPELVFASIATLLEA